LIRKFKYVNGTIRWAQPKKIFTLFERLSFFISFNLADIVVANSNAGKTLYAPKRLGIVINNGFDHTRISDIKNTDNLRSSLDLIGKKVIGMVANFTDYKDYKTFILAAQKVSYERDNVIFIAIGNGPRLEEFKLLVKKLGISDKFRILTEIEEMVAVFDIAVLSSFSEGMSNSIMEYMALAKPIIATDSGGTKELVSDMFNGFLIKKQDPQMLAEKILFLIDNPEIAIEFGDRGKKILLDKFSLEKMVNNYYNLYNSLQYPEK
jgi:glycosyltransferase involved in cell wall biosynthesis